MVIRFFIKKAPKRGDDLTTATIYVRLSDTHARDSISTTPLSINPNKWDAKNQCVKTKAIMDDALRRSINEQLSEFRLFLERQYTAEYAEYYKGWLKDNMRSFFGVKDNTRESCPNKSVSMETFFKTFDKFVTQKDIGKTSKQHYLSLRERLMRFEFYMREVKEDKLYRLNIHKFGYDDFVEFSSYVGNEYNYIQQYPQLVDAVPFSKFCKPRPMGENSLIGTQHYLHSFFKWCYMHQLTVNHSYMLFNIKRRNYGTPYYLTKEERDRLAQFDFSGIPFGDKYDMERDTFIFQCLIGCRISDLRKLTRDNIHGGFIEYIPKKTMKNDARTVRVPLIPQAWAIIDKYKDCKFKDGRLFHFYQFTCYEEDLKKIFKIAGLNRMVTVKDSLTGGEAQRPLYELAATHLARRTFIGNLYKKVQDPNLIASMSGHVEGSKAFARYRAIDDEMKENVIKFLE